ncbi:TonB-dependent receptor [Gemmatirosa kalamazoonensis]|uniref:TonB-dependent receptor n=1 Tax=Gemmatirosa kalamazoonensis TaxID=861299 RepID=W0RLS0_9BACT|nr:TonB-dependent receptor [Gemmatirosa kalamazoonensis]AHG91686.1 TonB-dependent receptor [Gemmatirosa kalamazoonensis]
MRRSPLVAALLLPAALAAQSSPPRTVDTVKVIGRVDDLVGTARSVSEGRVGRVDLQARPITREAELLETVPGFIATQHSGDGKANQYFVRGFNLDHGTDFATRLDGMPLNMPSHGHGQGYTDLNFLVPELVDHLDYALGVYHTEIGDFGSAGGAEFHLVRAVDRPFATVTGGANGLARVAAGGSSALGSGTLLLGGEVKRYDGPWVRPEGIRKYSGVARWSARRGASDWSILGMAYRNAWNASDQIPRRAVASGLVSRFGQIDSTDGGEAARYSLSAQYRHVGARAVREAHLYGIYSDLTLFSNFEYFLGDAASGDQFSQTDRRVVLGGSLAQTQQLAALGATHVVKFGVQHRTDLVGDVGLFNTVARRRVGTVRDDRVTETGTGVFAEAESRWTARFRSVLGVRGDAYTFDVSSDTPANSGHRAAAVASPKASLVFAPDERTELYVGAGLGFHSNDARGTTITVDPATHDSVGRVSPLVRSRGAEVGLRVSSATGLRSTVSLWVLGLDSELLFVGDAGATAPSAASRRGGVTLANDWRPLPSLSLDGDVSFARARFRGAARGSSRIPGALENVVAGGVTWLPSRHGAFGALRVRHFGSYPLVEDDAVRARASTLLNADAGYRLRTGVRMQVSVLNLANRRVDDIQYFYASRLPGEPASGVDDVHFHPAEPRQVRASLGWHW